MDNMKPTPAESGRHSRPDNQDVEAGQSEGVRAEAVEPIQGVRNDTGSRGYKKIKDWIIQLFQKILPENKGLDERKVTVEENVSATQGLTQYIHKRFENIRSRIVVVFAKISTAFRASYENDRLLARAIENFRDDPDELKFMIKAGVKLHRKHYIRDKGMYPPLFLAMKELGKYNLDQLDCFKELLDVLIEGGAIVVGFNTFYWVDGKDCQRPLDMAFRPLFKRLRREGWTTDEDIHKSKVVIKHLMEKGAELPRYGMHFLGDEVDVLIKFGCVDILRLTVDKGGVFSFRDFANAVKSGNFEVAKVILDAVAGELHIHVIDDIMHALASSNRGDEFNGKVIDLFMGVLKDENQLKDAVIKVLLRSAINQGFVYGAERIIALFPGKRLLENGDLIDLVNRYKWVPVEIVDLMIKNGCNINCQDSSGNTLLHLAVRNAEIRLINYLLRHNVDVNQKNHDGNTPFNLVSEGMLRNWDNPVYAASANINTGYIKDKRKECRGIMEVLIRNGADLNVKNNRGVHPLLFLAEKSDYDTVEFLIGNGADPRQSQSGITTPLHVACANNDRGLVELFSKYQSLVVSQNADGDTPLHLVLKQKNDKTDRWIRLLINAGADINQVNNAGETPKDLMNGVYDDKGLPNSRSLQQQAWREAEHRYDKNKLKEYFGKENYSRLKPGKK